MSAASPDNPAEPRPADTVIYPKSQSDSVTKPAPLRNDDGGRSSLILVVALLLAGAGAWILLQRRKAGPHGSRNLRKLQIDETRPLGNRQYLVVADYDGKKFLLGVAPGQIQMLTALEEKNLTRNTEAAS